MYEIISATQDIQVVYFSKVIMINNRLISINQVLSEKNEILKNVSDEAEFTGPKNSKITGKQIKSLLNKAPEEITTLSNEDKLLYAYAVTISGLLSSGVISVEELGKYDPIVDYNQIWIDKDINGAGKYKIPKSGAKPIAMADIIERAPELIADLEAAKMELDIHIALSNKTNVEQIGPREVKASDKLKKIITGSKDLTINEKNLVDEYISRIETDGDLSVLDDANTILAKVKLKLKLTDEGSVKLTTKASLMIMMGPAGVGKGVIQSKFVDQNGVVKWLINNTRDERVSDGEQYGVTYHFERSEHEQSINEKYKAIIDSKESTVEFVNNTIGSEENTLAFADELIDKYGISEMLKSEKSSPEVRAFAKKQQDFIRKAVDKLRTDKTISKMSPEGKANKIRGVEITAARMEELSKKFDNFIAHKFVNGIDLQGVSGEFVNRIMDGESIFLECDHGLAKQINNNPELQDIDMNILYLLPPTMTELVSRLSTRGTDPIEKVEGRLADAKDGMINSIGVANLYMESNDGTAQLLLDKTGIEVKVPITEKTSESDVLNNPQKYDGRLTTAHFIDQLKTKATGARDIVQIENKEVSEEEAVAELKSWLLKSFVLNGADVKDVTADQFIESARTTFGHLATTPKTEGDLLIMNGTFAPITYGHIGMAIQSLNQAVSTEGKNAVSVMVQGGDTPHKPYALAEKHRAASAEAGTVGNDFLKSSRIRGLMRRAFNDAGFESLPAAYSDMAAFMFISAQNPEYNIIWASGADKVNEYYGEKHLIKDVLADILGVKKFFYAERDDEKVNVFSKERPADDWMHEMNDNGFFVKLATPTIPVSSTIVRNKLMNDDVINDIVPNSTIDYIGKNNLKPAFQLSIVEKKIKKGFEAAGVSEYGKTIESFKEALSKVEDQAKVKELTELVDQMEALYKEAKAKGLL